MKPNWRFLKQVLRWTRNTWRSDIRSLFTERYVWTAHPYVAYTMVDKLFNPFTLLIGPIFVIRLMIKSTIPVSEGGYHLPWWNILASYIVWLFATRTAKLLPHLWHRPQDVIHVPAFILFGYYFAIMKLYALCTLHETGWGTRAGIGDASAATAAAAEADSARLQEKTAAANNPYGGYSNNNPYEQPQPQPYSYQQPQDSPFRDELSPFRDDAGQTSPYRDSPASNSDEGGTPVYAARARSQNQHGGRRGEYDAQVGYAT